MASPACAAVLWDAGVAALLALTVYKPPLLTGVEFSLLTECELPLMTAAESPPLTVLKPSPRGLPGREGNGLEHSARADSVAANAAKSAFEASAVAEIADTGPFSSVASSPSSLSRGG